MGLTATLVEQGHNHLRYLLTSDSETGGTAVLTTTGAPTPDILTDSLNGPLRECAEAFVSGIGILAPGAKTHAQSRAIWAAENSDTVLGNEKVPRALFYLKPRSATANAVWSADADVDGSGHPVINVIVSGVSSVATAYLEIETQGGIGL
jgi:hypothetical protein